MSTDNTLGNPYLPMYSDTRPSLTTQPVFARALRLSLARLLFALCSVSLWSGQSLAAVGLANKSASPWSGRFSLNVGDSSYTAGDIQQQKSRGLRLDIDHKDGLGLSFGLTRRYSDFTDTAYGTDNIPRSAFGLSTRQTEKTHFFSTKFAFPDQQTGGKIALRLNWARLRTEPPGLGLRALGGHLILQKSDALTMLDLGVHRLSSDTLFGESLKVTQWTPTFGFAISNTEWAQLRLYSSQFSNSQRSMGNKRANAVESKYVQLLPNSGWLLPEQLQLVLVKGKRLYAIDPDNFMLYNNGHVQTSGYSLIGQWPLYGGVKLRGGVSIDKYEAQQLNDETRYQYTQRYIYVNGVYEW